MKNEKINYWKVLLGFFILLVACWVVAALFVGFGAWTATLFTQIPLWGHVFMVAGGFLIVYPPLYKRYQEEGN